jgi:hypothetical protein
MLAVTTQSQHPLRTLVILSLAVAALTAMVGASLGAEPASATPTGRATSAVNAGS